jgi:hypothetical protein
VAGVVGIYIGNFIDASRADRAGKMAGVVGIYIGNFTDASRADWAGSGRGFVTIYIDASRADRAGKMAGVVGMPTSANSSVLVWWLMETYFCSGSWPLRVLIKF